MLLAPALTALLTLFALPQDPAEGPPAFHLGSYGTMRACRIDSEGALDSGAAVLRLADGRTGRPLEVEQIGYHQGSLVVHTRSQLGDLRMTAAWLGTSLAASGDERAVAGVQIRITNPTDAAASEVLEARLHPGGGDPDRRPWPSLDFDPSTVFALEERLVTRDGLALLGWAGRPEPTAELLPGPQGPDDVVGRLRWELEVQPRETLYLDIKLAGPAATAARDEEGWRLRFTTRSYGILEENLRWQWQKHGNYSQFASADESLWWLLVGNVHYLRSLGDGHYEVRELSDRLYGHPATDAAVEAEILAVLYEVGLDALGAAHLQRLVDAIPERLPALPPARRVAYLHGLARCMRLTQFDPNWKAVGQAILEHVQADLPVEPWLDPDDVRADLAKIVEFALLEGADELPRLAWAEVGPPESVAGRMLAMRRAMTARDGAAAWAILQELLAGAASDGKGSMERGGEYDGRFSMAMISLLRESLYDDHGSELELFPAIAPGMVTLKRPIRTGFMPTQYGLMKITTSYVGRHKISGIVNHMVETRFPDRMLFRVPAGVTVSRYNQPAAGGTMRILPGGDLLEVSVDPVAPLGLRFTCLVDKP